MRYVYSVPEDGSKLDGAGTHTGTCNLKMQLLRSEASQSLGLNLPPVTSGETTCSVSDAMLKKVGGHIADVATDFFSNTIESLVSTKIVANIESLRAPT